MGRPNQCDPCCGDIGDPPDPPAPISQCDDVVCIALIDENEKSVSNGGTFAGRDQMAVLHPLFRAAYPNRLLFVLDCTNSSKTMYYSDSFVNDPLAFSLRAEFDDPSGPAGLIRFLARDNGDNAIATANDPWGRILSIKEHYPSVKAIFDAATEIAVFVDDSDSLQGETQMAATVIRLKADATSSGYTNANPTPNNKEDIICPFAQSQCCTDNAQPLMDECGVDVDCGALALSFIKSPDDALIREYCTNVFPPNSPFQNVCSSCVSQQQEQDAHTIEYTAIATNSQGQNADFVEIRYSLQTSDNGTDWVRIENLDNGFSGIEQGLNALIDNWGGSSLDPDDCHQWLSDGGEYGGEWGQLGSDIDGEAFNDRSGFSVSLNAAGDLVAIGAPLNDGSNRTDSGHTRVFQWNGVSWTQLGSDIDGEVAGDYSGWSVSLNAAGDRVAIGATLNGGGHTRIFEWNGSSWTQLGSDIYAEAVGDFSGHSVSLNAAGDRVAIGAPYNDGNGDHSGHTRIFEWNGNSWVQLGGDIDGEASGDKSGYSVSLNAAGDRVAIGAPSDDGTEENSGYTRVFEWNGVSWTQLGSDIDGEAAGDKSGWSISLNAAGDRVAIGAPSNDRPSPYYGNGTSSGHTRVFEWNGSSWTQLGSDIDGESTGDQSGYSVSLNAAGDRVAIGATGSYGTGYNSGHTRVFQWNGSSWTQIGSDIDGEAAGDLSGYSVSLNSAGDRVAIGALWNDGGGLRSGHTRIFEWNGSSWTQLGSDIDGEAADDYSGRSVSLNSAGDRVAIGAPSNDNDEVYIDAGSTRIFDIETTPAGACLLYQDTTVGSCDRRTWTRQFRIKAETIGYPLTAFSDTFKIYELRSRSGTSYLTADGEWVGGYEYEYGDGITENPGIALGGEGEELDSYFGYSVYTAMERNYNSYTGSYYPRGHYWTIDPIYGRNGRIWRMSHDGDGSRASFDAFKASRGDYPSSILILDPSVGCDGILRSTNIASEVYYYSSYTGESMSSSVWQVFYWPNSHSWEGANIRGCQTLSKGGVVRRKTNRSSIDGYGFFVTNSSDLDSNVIITPYFRTISMDFDYRNNFSDGGSRQWYDVFISGINDTPGQAEVNELRYYKVWIDSGSIAEFGQLSLISTLETEGVVEVSVDYYPIKYFTIDDTDVFAQQDGYIKLSNLRDGSIGSVIYYFGGNDWREYSASFPDIQSELYPEVAGDGNYLYRIFSDPSTSNWARSVGDGLYTIRGEVYNPFESKYYPGIFVVRVYVDENGNTAVTRYGKPVASFVENDGFGGERDRVDCNYESLIVGAPLPPSSRHPSRRSPAGAVYYYMWKPNI